MRKKKNGTLRNIAFILIFVILFNTIIYLFPQMIEMAPQGIHGTLEGMRSFTEEKVVSKLDVREYISTFSRNSINPIITLKGLYTKNFVFSKEINESPAVGLQINVPKEAMDRKLELSANRLSVKEVLEINKDSSYEGPIVAAYDIHLGLQPDERLKKPMEISFDLNTIGIPQEEWGNLKIYRVDENGNKILINTRLDGQELKAFTTKNSGYFIVLGLAVGIPLFFYGQGLYNKGTSSYIGYDSIMEDGTSYRLLWSDQLVTDNVELMNMIRARITRIQSVFIKKEMNDLSESSDKIYVEKIVDFVRDSRKTADFIELENWTSKLLNSSGFPPFEVRQTEKVLKDVHSFLTNVKGLPPKNVMGVDIVIHTKTEWPHTSDPKAVAMSVNQRGPVLPYVDINAENILDMDELYLNLTHELFHVWQDDYYFVQGLRSPYYHSFLEGTAVLVEYEAVKYFSDINLPGGPRISTNVKPTDRDYFVTYSNPMEDNDTVTIQRHHGYTMSHFLEYLRDNHANDKDKYVKKLMDVFGGMYSFSTNKALYRSVDKSASEFSDIFLKYCMENAEKMAKGIESEQKDEGKSVGKEKLLKDINQSISPQKPYFEWGYAVEKPLSCEFRMFNVQKPYDKRQMDEGEKDAIFKDVKILIHNNGLESQGIKLQYSIGNNDNWKDCGSKGVAIDIEDVSKLSLQRVSTMVNTSWMFPAKGRSQVAVMYAPDYPEVAKKENDSIEVKMNKNILAENGLLKGYEIYIKAPGSSEVDMYVVNGTNPVQTFKLPDYERISTDPKLYNKPYEIYYREIASIQKEGGDVFGPESMKAYYTLVEDLFVGKYVGKCTFDNTIPDTYEKYRIYQLERVGATAFDYSNNSAKTVDNQNYNSVYQSSSFFINNEGNNYDYSIDAKLPGMNLQGYLIYVGMAPDRWASRYIVTDREGNKLGYLYFVTRESIKPEQKTIYVELEMSDSPEKFGKDREGFEWFPIKYTGFYYKDGNKPKLEDHELKLKELFKD